MKQFLLIAGILLSLSGFSQKPNIIFIMSDDHDNDAISAYNKTFINTPGIDRIAKEGMLFKRCFVGNSICSPARATLLTGQHSHLSGVRDNRDRFDSSRLNLAKLLQQTGYQTAVIGKWHLQSYPTGFDYWSIFPGQGLYYDPRIINMKGDTVTRKGYASDITTDDAIKWIAGRDPSKPFSLFYHHKAPHRYFFPPLKYLEQFAHKKFPEPSTLYADTTGRGSAWRMQTMSILPDMKLSSDLKVDPIYLMDIPELKPDSTEIAYYQAIMRRVPQNERERYKEIYAERGKIIKARRPLGKELLALKYQWYMQDYMATVASVDENVGRFLKYLDSAGLSKNTIVVYTSDQGFYLGENGWFDKRFMYDVSMQTPFMVRWPGHIAAGKVSDAMVQNIDFAPTILTLAGAPVPEWMQGKSLDKILTGKQKALDRPYLYYHYYEYVKDHTVIPHTGIRGERYKLIHFYTVNEWQLYDLKLDPTEQKDLSKDPKHAKLLSELKEELKKQQAYYKDNDNS